MHLTPCLIAAIQAHAVAAYPQEACGVIVQGAYHPCPNLSPTPRTHFSLDLSPYPGAAALVHSHPDGLAAPSAADMAQQRAMGLPWVIVTATAQGAGVPFVLGGPPAPLIGRRFRHGVHDCYSLIQDWYATQGQRALTPDVPRDWAWWNAGQNLYADTYALAGWRRVRTPQVGAVALIQTPRSPVLNHAGVMAAPGWLLHHAGGAGAVGDTLSTQERLTRWLPLIKYWIEHPAFVLAAD